MQYKDYYATLGVPKTATQDVTTGRKYTARSRPRPGIRLFSATASRNPSTITRGTYPTIKVRVWRRAAQK